MNKEERAMYNVSLKRKWDAEAIRQYQEERLEKGIAEGMQKGMEKGLAAGIEKGMTEGMEIAETKARNEKLVIARKLLAKGMEIQEVVDLLGLTATEVLALK